MYTCRATRCRVASRRTFTKRWPRHEVQHVESVISGKSTAVDSIIIEIYRRSIITFVVSSSHCSEAHRMVLEWIKWTQLWNRIGTDRCAIEARVVDTALQLEWKWRGPRARFSALITELAMP